MVQCVLLASTVKKYESPVFCHIYVEEPFYYLLPPPMEGKRKLPRWNKAFILIYLVCTYRLPYLEPVAIELLPAGYLDTARFIELRYDNSRF